jgi:effector-binding domain-containing protein
MLKKMFYVIAALAIAFVVAGFFLPSEVHVERSVAIDRPAATVFTLVNGFRTFNSWSPWAQRDPEAQFVYSGPDLGVGARLEWSGDPRLVGNGWQEITDSQPDSLVRMHLDFDQQGAADSYFQLSGLDNGVSVTWGFDTDLTKGQSFFNALLAKYFGLFFDKWIGTDYEEGLANLKAFAEALPPADFSDLSVEVLQAEPLDILYISGGSSQDPEDIAGALASAYREISTFMAEHEMEMSSQPMAITRAWDEEGYEFDAAIPVEMKEVELSGHVQAGQSPSGRAVRVIHTGPYDEMISTYEKLSAYMAVHGLAEGQVSWEHYISDPGTTAEEELVTHVYFQVAE